MGVLCYGHCGFVADSRLIDDCGLTIDDFIRGIRIGRGMPPQGRGEDRPFAAAAPIDNPRTTSPIARSANRPIPSLAHSIARSLDHSIA
jgi:hypothetical protein